MATMTAVSRIVESRGFYLCTHLPFRDSKIGQLVDDFFFNVPIMRRFSCKQWVAIGLQLSAAVSPTVEKGDFDVFDYVDPLIGTASGGEVLLRLVNLDD
jgi:hypothetical protein